MENIPECAARIRAAVEQGRLQEALDLVDANLAEYGNHPEFLKAEALLCGQSGEYDTAIRLLKKAAEAVPADGEIYYYLTQCYEQKCYVENNETVIEIDTGNKRPIGYGSEINIYKNRKSFEELYQAADAPLVSIFFLAYNGLEQYTKPALSSLLKYTRNVNYELILIDNGSADGTLDYFKNLDYPGKIIYHITKNVGGPFGFNLIERAVYSGKATGKYIVYLPNDVCVTKNWLRNMLICAENVENVGMIVPYFDHCSNLQQYPLACMNLEELQKIAAKYNQSNPRLWEERTRLITVIFLTPREVFRSGHFFDAGFVYSCADDDMSMRYRRMGYKLIHCGDTILHHAGSSIVGKNREKNAKDLENGRQAFRQKYYGLDAWDSVANYERQMVSMLLRGVRCSIEDDFRDVFVLGIDVRCGMPLLDVKNGLRRIGYFGAKLSAFTQEAKYYLDLQSICDNGVVCASIQFFLLNIGSRRFNYIVCGEYMESAVKLFQVLELLFVALEENGRIAFKVKYLVDIELDLQEKGYTIYAMEKIVGQEGDIIILEKLKERDK